MAFLSFSRAIEWESTDYSPLGKLFSNSVKFNISMLYDQIISFVAQRNS